MSTPQISARSIKALAFVLAGPVIWAAHFFALYATEAFLCNGGTFSAAAGAVRPIGLTLTVIALAALSIFVSWQALLGLRTKRAASIDAHVYRKISIGLAAIALLAVTWGVLPAILLPACMPAA
jgi:hypothetical protein